MGANCFLVRYAGGWAERKSSSSIATYGRQEALLGLGSITSLAEVNRVADGQLAEFNSPREQTDILIDPRWNSEAPYLGFTVGDTVTVQGTEHRVLGLSVTEDPNNDRVIFVPTLNDNVVLNAQERVSQTLQKMVRGTLGGRSKVAQPVIPAYYPRPRGAAPGTCFTESFNQSDGSIGPDLDWIVQFGTPETVSNLLTAGGSGDGGASAQHDTSTEDMSVQIDVVSGLTGIDNQIYLVGRTDDSFATGVALNVISGNNGATTPIILYDWSGAAPASTNVGANLFTGTWRLELEGNEGRAYRNDVLMLTVDITGFSGSGNTRAGLEVTAGTGGSPTFDNFEYCEL